MNQVLPIRQTDSLETLLRSNIVELEAQAAESERHFLLDPNPNPHRDPERERALSKLAQASTLRDLQSLMPSIPQRAT